MIGAAGYRLHTYFPSDPTVPVCRAAYDKRKYMWKLLYTRVLGYDVDFGQKQAMDLIAATGSVE